MSSTTSVKSSRMSARNAKPEPIRPSETLVLPDFLSRTSMKDAAWAQVKRQCADVGIQIAFVVGRQVYVSTDAWLAFLQTRPVPVPKKCNPRQRAKSNESRIGDLVSAAE
jgi:hypothetical protein